MDLIVSAKWTVDPNGAQGIVIAGYTGFIRPKDGKHVADIHVSGQFLQGGPFDDVDTAKRWVQNTIAMHAATNHT